MQYSLKASEEVWDIVNKYLISLCGVLPRNWESDNSNEWATNSFAREVFSISLLTTLIKTGCNWISTDVSFKIFC